MWSHLYGTKNHSRNLNSWLRVYVTVVNACAHQTCVHLLISWSPFGFVVVVEFCVKKKGSRMQRMRSAKNSNYKHVSDPFGSPPVGHCCTLMGCNVYMDVFRRWICARHANTYARKSLIVADCFCGLRLLSRPRVRWYTIYAAMEHNKHIALRPGMTPVRTGSDNMHALFCMYMDMMGKCRSAWLLPHICPI